KSDTKTAEALRALESGNAVAVAAKAKSNGNGKAKTNGARAASVAEIAPPHEAITVQHAREHNLKDVSCSVPHGKLCVVTGPSGSGKSSLAFDVIFAEGQRRFMETLTPYARQFLPTLPRPDVDLVSGVPP